MLLLYVIDCATYLRFNPPGGKSWNTGRNGIWLRYLWYFDQKTSDEKEALVSRLAQNRFKYAFFHVRGTDVHGQMIFKYEDKARRLVDWIHDRLPETKAVAWLYVPSNFGREGVDLSDSTSRKNLVESCRWLVEDCGFDGVQIDYEFFPNDDKEFPFLLEDVRKAVGPLSLISVATPMWYPGALWGWDDNHFTSVAEHCDQIAVMGYDSWLYSPRLYSGLMSQQAVQVTRAVSRARNKCTVLLGIPVYDTDSGTPAHLTFAENIVSALKGVREGLSDPGAVPSVFEGVAPFAEYTMEEDEWQEYRRLWLDVPGKK